MQISALIQLLKFLIERSNDPSLVESYSRLAKTIKDDPGNKGRNLTSQIEKEKELLCELLIKTDPTGWGYSSYRLFTQLNSDRLFGKQAAEHIESLFTPGQEDYRLIHSEILKKIKLMSRLSDTMNRFLQNLDQLMPAELMTGNTSQRNDLTMFLYFEGRLSVKSIQDMERYSRLWTGILNAFCGLIGSGSLDLEIISYNEGNFTLGLAAEDKILKAVIEGVTGILSSLPLIMKIRKTQADIARLPLKKDVNALLEEEIQNLINQKALELATELVQQVNKHNSEYTSLIDDISRSLKQMLNFVERGGKFEFRSGLSASETAIVNKILTDSYALAYELDQFSGTDSDQRVSIQESSASETEFASEFIARQ
jgi:hypothetical protein